LLFIFICVSCSGKKKPVEEEVYRESTHTVKKNEFFETIIAQVLPHETLRRPLIEALEHGGFPFRRCLPGDSIHVLTKNNAFMKLTYYQNLMNTYYVTNNDNHLFVAMKFPYIDTVTCIFEGAIKSTLYDAILEMGETPNLVFRYADVFAWEIDFVTDTREGDSFFIYLEKTFCDSNFLEYNNLIMMRYKGNYVGDYYGIYYRDPEGNEDYYNLKGESLRKSLLKSPLRYSYISSYFTKRRFHPILKIWRPHHGLDYVAPIGTPVSTIGDGVVSFKGWKGGYGNLIEIKHKNGFKTRYGHLSKFAKGIYNNKKVKMGELIGYVGSTGLSTGPHLHFEMHKDGVAINPLKVNIPRAPSVKKEYFSAFEQYRDSLLQYIEELTTHEAELLSNNN
jgi:murein DD-endopeptidase MepM/ murein hydrolase activator NlpD